MRASRWLLFWGLVVLGVGAAAYLVASFNPAETWRIIFHSGPYGFAIFFVNYFAVILIQTVGWDLLLRAAGHRIPFRWLLTAMLMGFVGNFVTPSMYVGGEPIRAYFIGAKFHIAKRRVMGTIVLHKFLEFTGFLVAMVACGAVTVAAYDLPAPVKIVMGTADIILAAVFVALAVSFFRNAQVTVRVCRFLAGAGIGRGFFTRLGDKARDMEQLIHETVTLRWPTTLLSLLLTGGTQLLVVLKAPIFLWVAPGAPAVPTAGYALLYVLTQIVLIFQFTPGGLGVFEGGEVAIFRQLGMAAPLAMGYAAFTRGADLLVVAAGTALLVHYGLLGLLRKLLAPGEGEGTGPDSDTPTGPAKGSEDHHS